MKNRPGTFLCDELALSGVRYSTVLLDLDHTLFDSDFSESAAFGEAMRVAGVDDPAPYAESYRRINVDLWSAVEREEISPQRVRDHRFERLVEEEKLDADPRRMASVFVAGLAKNGDLYSGAREVIEELSDKVSLALVTNGLSEVQRARIERLGIGSYFDAIVISAEVGTSKPGTKIFDIAFDALLRPPKESAVMVGDSLSSDIRGGSNYGIATCWYNPKGRKSGPDDRVSHQIGNLSELFLFVNRDIAARRS